MADALLKLSELSNPAFNDTLKGNFSTVFKLLRTVTEFLQKTSAVHEQAGTTLLSTVESFRKKSQDLKKERLRHTNIPNLNSLFSSWETLLAEMEQQAQDLIQMAGNVTKRVTTPLSDLMNKHKQLSKKMFAYRDGLESQVQKADDAVAKQQKEYFDVYAKLTKAQETEQDKVSHQTTLFHNSHNNYVFHLQVLSTINDELRSRIIAQVLEDLQSLQENITYSVSEAYIRHSNIMKESFQERIKHVERTFGVFTSLNAKQDISLFVKSVNIKPDTEVTIRKFQPPDGHTEELIIDESTQPVLKRKFMTLQKTCESLKKHISKDEEALTTLENNNKGKAFSTFCEELFVKKNELRSKQLQRAVTDGQLSLFTSQALQKLGPIDKETCEETGEETERKARSRSSVDQQELHHLFMANTFKTPTTCDYCKSLIIGLFKQGLRCKVCKMNIHGRCKENVSFCHGPQAATAQTSFHVNDTTHITPSRVAPPPPPSKKPPEPLNLQNRSQSDQTLYCVKDLKGVENAMDENDMEHIYVDINLPSPPPEPPVAKPRHKVSMPKLDMELAYPKEEDQAAGTQTWGDSYDTAGSVLDTRSPEYTEMQSNVMGNNNDDMCVALFDFKGSNNDLSLSAGDIIQVTNKAGEDWWEGTCQTRRGYFPATYVQTLNEGESVYKTLFSFEAQGEDELSLEENQIVFVLSDEGDGWLFGRSDSGEGVLPSGYVQKLYEYPSKEDA